MRVKNFRIIALIFMNLFAFSVISCKKHGPVFTRMDLSDAVEYVEAPPGYMVGDIIRMMNDFKPLDKASMGNLTGLLENEENYLWLRIRFDIPKEMQNNDLGLFIGYLHSADRLWINNSLVRVYGSFPPNALGAGYQAQYFMFPRNILKQKEPNVVLMQVMTGQPVFMSDQIFLGSQMDVFRLAERRSFFNSKIFLCFAVIMLLVFVLYMYLYLKMRRFNESRIYLYFGLLVFYSIGFLVPFFIAEVAWLKPIFITYLGMLKWFLCFGIYTAVYFSSSFLTNWLRCKESKKVIVIRLLLWFFPLLFTLLMPTYNALITYSRIFGVVLLAQFVFCTPNFIKAFRDGTRRILAIQALMGYLPVCVGMCLDGIFRMGLHNRNFPFFTIYSWQLTLYIFLFYLMGRFASMYAHTKDLKEQLTEFNAHLEDVVAIRTKELSETNFVLSRGLETVSHVQQNFLPKPEKVFKGWDFSAVYIPLDNDVSGDLYDYYYNEQILEGLGIFDVSGHGIPAGLMTILAKGIINQRFLNGLAQGQPMSKILEEINTSYIKEKSNVENYITGLLFHFSEFNKKDVCDVEFANAGHPAPLLYAQEKDEVAELKYDDPNEQYGILGVDGLPVSFPSVSCRMAPGDVLVCFTDGLTEAFNADSDEFGKDGVASVLKENAGKSAKEIKNAIMEAHKAFVENQKPFDDLTLIVLKRTASKDFLEEI